MPRLWQPLRDTQSGSEGFATNETVTLQQMHPRPPRPCDMRIKRGQGEPPGPELAVRSSQLLAFWPPQLSARCAFWIYTALRPSLVYRG